METLDNNTQQPGQPGWQPIPVPNATGVLVLGIISIVGSLCYGIVGLVCGIIALVLAKKARAAYAMDPSRYSLPSYNNMNAGRICAIIGTILSVLLLIGSIFYIYWIVNMMGEMGTFPRHRY
jgi:hypothetical protein